MAYKTKFLHFKTKASYEAERAKTTEGSEERKVFDAYISFIDEGPTICTWGKEYQCDANSLSLLPQEVTTEKQDQVFKNLGWKVHVISQSDINATTSPDAAEKTKRLEATTLLVKETSLIYVRGNDDSSNHYFFKINSSSQLELIRISITTGIIYSINSQFVDPGAIRYDITQTLSNSNKTLARENIDAANKNDVLPLTIDLSSQTVEDYNTALEAFNSKKPLTIFDSTDPTSRFTANVIEKEATTNDINVYFSFTGLNDVNTLNMIGYVGTIKPTGEKTSSFAVIMPSNTDPKPLGPLASSGTDNAYSRSDHVHPAQVDITGNAATATKLATTRTVSLSGDVTGSTTFDGSKNVAITTAVVDNSHNHSASTITNVYDGSIIWGGRDIPGNFGPLDGALVSELGANRFAFLKPKGLTAEYSIDGGTTWIEYPNNINLSGGIFGAGKGPSLTIDPLNNKENITSLYKVRVTINAGKSGIYTQLNKFIIYLSTNGSNGCTVDITGKKNGSDDYVNLKTKVPILGWSGYNVINHSLILGGSSTNHISDLRFTFNITSHNSANSGLQIIQILAFGGVGWTTPSALAKTGHLYSCDLDQNATFPSTVIANKFTTVGGTANNLVAGNGSLINITDIKNGGNASKLSSARTFALTGAVIGSASSDLTNGVSINTTLSNLDASKITSGTLNADRLPEIPIEKLPAGALERLFIVASQSAAVSLVTGGEAQDGDTVQITGENNQMYFVVNDKATTFATIFKAYTAGSATSVPWSGVTGKPTFATVATSGSYNDLTNKPTIPSLSGYATQNWVTSQGYLTSIPAATSSTYGGIQIGYTTSGKNYAVQLNNGKAYVNVPWTDTNTTYTAGTNISISGTAINCTYSYSLPTATASVLGGVKIGSNISVSSGTISLTSANVTSALGFTPAKTSDIPEIPIALPNPYALTINGTSYTGSSAVSITTPKPLITTTSFTGTQLSTTINAGYSYSNTLTRTVTSLNGFSESNPDAVIISTNKIFFNASNAIKMDGLEDLAGGTYYIYCLSYMANGKVAVNGAVYA